MCKEMFKPVRIACTEERLGVSNTCLRDFQCQSAV
jgi:hypothetical protein